MKSLALSLLIVASLGCSTRGLLSVLPLSWHPIGAECPGPLAPVERIEEGRVWQAQYRLRTEDGEAALTLAGERRGSIFVLVGLDPLGSQAFVIVQRGVEVSVDEHVPPLFPWPPENVLRDLHLAAFLEPDEFGDALIRKNRTRSIIEHPDCGTGAVVSLLPTGS
jgi:hypothetical protein